MAYLPKTQYKKSSTPNKNYIDPTTGEIYLGEYIETSEGVFKGNNPILQNQLEVIKPKITSNEDSHLIPYSNVLPFRKNMHYSSLNTGPSNYLLNKKEIVATKPKPTEKDYERGYFYRYFAVKLTSNTHYTEIKKKTYNELSSGSTYDQILYKWGKIKWGLQRGSSNLNLKRIITLKNGNFPLLNIIFPQTNEFENDQLNIKPSSLSPSFLKLHSSPQKIIDRINIEGKLFGPS